MVRLGASWCLDWQVMHRFFEKLGATQGPSQMFENLQLLPQYLKGVCWLCDAGRTNGPPYEDVNVLTAEWVRTCGPRNPLPWDTPSKLLEHLFVNDDDLAGFLLTGHFSHLLSGVWKRVCCFIIDLHYEDRVQKAKARVQPWATQWLLAALQTAAQKRESQFWKENIFGALGVQIWPRLPSQVIGARVADTAFVTKFIDWLMVEIFRGDHGDEWGSDAILHGIQAYGKAVGAFFRILYASGYFLESNDAKEAIFNGLACSRQFVALATLCVGKKLCLFKVTPKLHMFCHVLLAMLQQYRIDPTAVINPLAQATFQCEDFVGRVARLSRRVSPKIHGTKVILRYLAAIEKSLKDEEAWDEGPEGCKKKNARKNGEIGQIKVTSKNDMFQTTAFSKTFFETAAFEMELRVDQNFLDVRLHRMVYLCLYWFLYWIIHHQ